VPVAVQPGLNGGGLGCGEGGRCSTTTVTPAPSNTHSIGMDFLETYFNCTNYRLDIIPFASNFVFKTQREAELAFERAPGNPGQPKRDSPPPPEAEIAVLPLPPQLPQKRCERGRRHPQEDIVADHEVVLQGRTDMQNNSDGEDTGSYGVYSL
jgi:hypothetical protein